MNQVMVSIVLLVAGLHVQARRRLNILVESGGGREICHRASFLMTWTFYLFRYVSEKRKWTPYLGMLKIIHFRVYLS